MREWAQVGGRAKHIAAMEVSADVSEHGMGKQRGHGTGCKDMGTLVHAPAYLGPLDRVPPAPAPRAPPSSRVFVTGARVMLMRKI